MICFTASPGKTLNANPAIASPSGASSSLGSMSPTGAGFTDIT